MATARPAPGCATPPPRRHRLPFLAFGAALAVALLGALAPARTALAQPAPAADPAPDCPPHAPRLRVTIEDPEPRLLAGADIDELHARTRQPRTPRIHHLALTSSQIEWQSEITARYVQGPREGPVCAVPGEVTLRLVHVEHSIRLAREIPEGGCLWHEVVAHERRHVAVNRRSLRNAEGRIRAAALAWARQAEARGPSVDEAVAQLHRGLQRAIAPVLARMRAEREAGHRAIDTAAEYDRLARICPADQTLLREALGER